MSGPEHTPADEVRALRAAVRALHKELLGAVQRRFEKLHRRVQGPGELLELAAHDPLFEWLKPLSERLVELEELDVDAVAREQAAALRAGFGRLLDADGEFAAVYRVYLQSEPDVVIAHAELRRALRGALPRSSDS